MEGNRIKRLEVELEHVRSLLYQYVDGVPSRLLADPKVLPTSILLDGLILEVQKKQARKQ